MLIFISIPILLCMDIANERNVNNDNYNAVKNYDRDYDDMSIMNNFSDVAKDKGYDDIHDDIENYIELYHEYEVFRNPTLSPPRIMYC